MTDYRRRRVKRKFERLDKTPLPKPAKTGTKPVHPNSMAARKWGLESWTFRGDGAR